MTGRIAYYHWLDWFTQTWHSTRCEVLSESEKTYRIKLLECARGGSNPGTQLNVRKKSVTIPFDTSDSNMTWKNYNYFE